VIQQRPKSFLLRHSEIVAVFGIVNLTGAGLPSSFCGGWNLQWMLAQDLVHRIELCDVHSAVTEHTVRREEYLDEGTAKLRMYTCDGQRKFDITAETTDNFMSAG
jgi:hypothetical protein